MGRSHRRVRRARQGIIPARQRLLGESLERRYALDSTVVFNELNYHPAAGDESLEWIELHNQMAVNIDLSLWSIRGVGYTFPQGTVLAGGGYLVVAKSPAALQAAVGYATAFGPYPGNLDNDGEDIELVNHNDRVMDAIDYGDDGKWPVAPDGSGATLSKLRKDSASEPAANWSTSPFVGGTPGVVNYAGDGPAGPSEHLLVSPGTQGSVLIPAVAEAGLGTSWTAEGFDDSSWTTALPGVGYDTEIDFGPADPVYSNVALGKPVISGSGAYPADAFNVGSFPAQRVTDGSTTDVFGVSYWLGREGVGSESFVLDLLQSFSIQEIRLRNTHNTQYNDRGTANFRIFASNSVDASNQLIAPVQILTGTLPAVTNQSPINPAVYTSANGLSLTSARYLRFEALSSTYGNNNVGLNEIEVYATSILPRTNAALGKPVVDWSGVYQFYAGFDASNVTDGSTADAFSTGVAHSATYWLGREGVAQEYFTVDLLGNVHIDEVRLRNTHNDPHNDRGTAQFQLYAALAVDQDNQLIDPQLVLSGTLSTVSGQNPITANVYTPDQGLIATTARYLRLNTLSSSYGNGNVGLNEIEVYGLSAPAPIAYWTFDDSLTDSSGQGYTGTAGAPVYSGDTPAAIGQGKSLAFDGLDDYVSALVNVSESSYTTSLWFKTSTSGAGMFAVVDTDLGANGHDRHLYLNSGDVRARTWSDETIGSTGVNYADGQWHHLVHVVGQFAAGQKIYIDGVPVAAGIKSSSDFSWQTRVNIGFSNDAPSPYFNGMIDDVAIWSAVLSPSEIQALYAGASPLALNGYLNQIVTDVESSMKDQNASAWLRSEFSVPTEVDYDALALDIRYDDGFVAYLNGTLVAADGAPPVPAWDSAATATRPDRQAVISRTFDLTPHLALLHSGTNVLAIHGLNDSSGDNDFLIFPELRAHIAQPIEVDPGLFINEVDASGDATFWLELHNSGTAPIELDGFVLTSTEGFGGEYILPTQNLAPGQHLTLDEGTLGFGAADGDRLFLYGPGKSAVIDAVTVRDRLRGRSPDGVGAWRYPDAATPGAANSFAFHDQIVINEIMYHRAPQFPTEDTPATYGAPSIYVPLDGTWKYHQSNVNLGINWRTVAFNDSGWASGGALFYNEASPLPGPKVTPINLNVRTIYFRTTFQFSGDPSTALIDIRHVVDDGAVFYLNGVELTRFNMPTGTITFSTLSNVNVNNAVLVTAPSIQVSNLIQGNNVLAVELHQVSPISDDAVFGAEISIREVDTPVVPGLTYTESPEEWVELYNRSNTTVDLAGWQFDDAIHYDFPAGTTMAAGEYLVVAKDPASLAAKFPTTRILGPYSDSLSRSHDRIVLEDTSRNPADAVEYFDGGRWHDYADGNGSSLELRNPDADNSRAESWAASDETSRATWQHFSYTGMAQAPVYDPVTSSPGSSDFREFVMGLLDSGEVLVDNLSVIEDPAGTAVQKIQNGSFQADTVGGAANKWRIQGTHDRSHVVADPDNAANKVLRLIADGKADYLGNHAETTFVNNIAVVSGRTYQISFDARWIAGSPQLRTELYYNRLPAVTIIQPPTLSGTPGSQNSQYVANIGPTYSEFRHAPAVPAPGENATVSVKADDPDGVAAMTLWYSVAGGVWTSTPMSFAAGTFSASVPGQAAGTVVQFYVSGQDSLGAVSTYPAAGAISRALIKWDDGQAQVGLRHNFRMVMTAADANFLYAPTNMMSNDRLGGTVVYDEREVFYDVGIRLRGSMFSRNSASSTGYNVSFQPDQLFRGVHSSATMKTPGKIEMLVKHVANQAGVPSMYDDYVYMNTPTGVGSGVGLMGMARFGEEFIDSQFEDGGDGTVFKMQGIRVMLRAGGSGPEDLKTYFPNIGWIPQYDLANLGNDPEQYRWSIQIGNNRAADDYSRIVDMGQALSLSGAALQTAVEEVLDVDQWMRTMALMNLMGIGDAYSQGNPHNLDFYVRPEDNKVLAFPWDWNFTFSYPSNSALFGIEFKNITKVIQLPTYTRIYYGHMLDMINTVYNTGYMGSWITHYSALAGEDYSSGAAYITARDNFVVSALPAQVPFVITTNGGADFSVTTPTTTLAGNGWINVHEILIDGRPDPLNLTWTDIDSWQTQVPLVLGDNPLTLRAFDRQGNQVGVDTITISTTADAATLEANLRITELMYHPADPPPESAFLNSDDFEFVELQNTGTQTLDLTGVQFVDGIDFTFPATTLPAGQRVLVVRSLAAFEERYGTGLNVAGQYTGNFNNAGEPVRLETALGTTIHEFTYDDDGAGWHPITDGDGPSLTIVSTAQPLANWSLGTGWRASYAAHGTPGADDPPPVSVVARRVFYNNSAWDGNSSAANAADDAAVATDKSPLLPGGTGSLANYTSFSKGITGIFIDVANFVGPITAADFTFKTGNSNNTATWTTLATAPTITVRSGAGSGGSTRIALTWPDDTIKKTWLQVVMLAGANTGLAAQDVFYFGNAVGEAGDTSSNALVNATDEILARANPRNILNPAPITFLHDYNRDKLVNATDQILARSNTTNVVTALRLIVPAPSAGAVPDAGALADAALMADGDEPADILARRRR